MEKEVMFKIYNTLFDSKKELEIKNVKIYTNLEQSLCVSYDYNGEKYVIYNDIVEREE